MCRPTCIAFLLGPLLASLPWGVRGEAPSWSQFRGPQSAGVADPTPLQDRWTATEHVLWKADVPGRGWSSPVVWGGRAYLTTVVNTGPVETQRKGLYLGGERPQPPTSVHLWKVLCYDLESGKLIWERQVHEGVPTSSIHLKNTYASETPATDGERVYVYFGNVGVFCLDLDGQPVWEARWPALRTANGWGTGGSPVVHGDHLYVLNDNEEQSYLAALDKRNGKEVWRAAREDGSSWSTPFVWHNDQRVELIVSGSGRVQSYDLQGQPLWSLSGMSRNAIPTPFAHGGLLYVASGHVMSKVKPLAAILPGAAGDITPTGKETTGPYLRWMQKQAAPYQPSPLVHGDYLYVLLDAGMFACYRADNGEVVYPKQRIPEGRAFTASPWAAGDKIYCLNEDGVTFVLAAGTKFEVLHSNPLAEDDMCLATPAIVGGRLLIRSAGRLYCIGSPETQTAAR